MKKKKLLDLIEHAFKKIFKNEGKLYLAFNDKKRVSLLLTIMGSTLWSCQNVCDAFDYFLDNIYIKFGNKLYKHISGIPMGTNCAPLVADLFLFCYKRDISTSLSDDNQAYNYY